MEEGYCTCFSFTMARPEDPPIHTERRVVSPPSSGRAQWRDGLGFAEVMLLVFSTCSGASEALLCQESSRWNHTCENLRRKACCEEAVAVVRCAESLTAVSVTAMSFPVVGRLQLSIGQESLMGTGVPIVMVTFGARFQGDQLAT